MRKILHGRIIRIRAVIEMKNNAYEEYRLENLTTELSNKIRDTKNEHYNKLSATLVDSSTSAKAYWSVLKTFPNGRKVPVIALLLINNELIFNFTTKVKYFNKFFIQKCTEISVDSFIPSSVNLATNETLTNINFDEQLISKLILA